MNVRNKLKAINKIYLKVLNGEEIGCVEVYILYVKLKGSRNPEVIDKYNQLIFLLELKK